MKCDEIKLFLMDVLYGEASDQEIQHVKDHLTTCEDCREEARAFRATSKTLQRWEGVDPKLNFLFVSEKASWRSSLVPKKIAYGLALGFACILILLAAANTEIRYQQGNFSLKMNLLPSKGEEAAPATDAQMIYAQLQQQHLQLVQQMIRQSEERQQQQLVTALNHLSNTYENRRTSDLQLLGVGMDEIEKNLYHALERKTDDRFNNLIRYISAQQGQK